MPERIQLQQIDAIYEAAPIGLCVLDADLRYIRINQRLAEINGVPASAHIGRTLREVLPQVADRSEALLRRVLDTGEAVRDVEIVAPDSTGTLRTIVLHCLPLHGPDDTIVGINVVVEDITERNQAQARLRAMEQRLWLHTENSPLAVIEWDASCRITRWGGAAQAMFGWRAEEVIGAPLDRIGFIADDDRSVLQRVLGRFGASGTPRVVSTSRNFTRDGRAITCEWYSSLLTDDQGHLVSVLSLIDDVTAQRRADREERLRAEASMLLSESLDAAATLDALSRLAVPGMADASLVDVVTPDRRIERRAVAYRRPDVEAALGRLEASDAQEWASERPGVRVLRTGRPVLMPHADCACAAVLAASGAAPSASSCSVLSVPVIVDGRTEGAWTWIRTRPEPFDGRDLALAEELAHRAALAIRHAQLFAAVETANRTKDQFLATLGHELRQPVGALASALGVLRARAEGGGAGHAWDVAQRQVEHIARLLEDLLDLSRIERGKLTLRREAVDLRGVATAATEVNARLLQQRGHRIAVLAPGEPVSVIGDDARLQQVISNLIHNAAKFTPDGGQITVTVSATGEQATVSVRDSGQGITPQQLQRIFEPFAQGDNGSGGGLGVGLAVVRQLVQLHGGSVDAYSEGEGAGSEFVVVLPLAPSATPAEGLAIS